ncbi:MAG: hypothetical protein GY814_02770 [Gammaproteobacteria bacterium]|nr:hypothetical protein [Gammaproteobacteria bacterium]
MYANKYISIQLAALAQGLLRLATGNPVMGVYVFSGNTTHGPEQDYRFDMT